MQQKRPQVILLNSSYAPSLLQFRGKLIEALLVRGHKVHLSGPNLTPELVRQLEALGASVHEVPLSRLGFNPFRDLAYTFALWHLIRKTRTTFVINYTIKPNIWGALAARLAFSRSASMVTGLGFAFSENSDRKGNLIKAAIHRLYAMATSFNEKVIFQNPDDLNDFQAAGCLSDPDKAVLVNGSGIDITEFSAAPLPDQPAFLMIARFLKAKGLREYGRAIAGLQKSGKDYQFFLAGFPDDGVDGLSAAELDELLASGVEHLGHLDDVRPAIARSSIYVLPSYREGTPRTVLEALAMGRAVITTDAPGCRETVSNGENGLLVAIANSDELQNAMAQLGSDPARVALMGQKSRRLAETKYDVRVVNQFLLEQLGL